MEMKNSKNSVASVREVTRKQESNKRIKDIKKMAGNAEFAGPNSGENRTITAWRGKGRCHKHSRGGVPI